MEHSAGFILFREREKRREYLLLKHVYKSTFWSYPKGIIEKGETEQEAAFREAREETGAKKIKLIPDFKEKTSFFKKVDGKTVYKKVTWFLGEVSTPEEGRVSGEHQELKWFSYEGALRILTFNSEKELLKKAKKKLQGR